MQFYAHSKQNNDGTQAPKGEWEPLFTPFGNGADQCQREHCPKCESLESHHGHLNKVAWWAAKFAAEMFPEGKDREDTRQWGYLSGLWHDLGKFSTEFQNYLQCAGGNAHDGEGHGRVDHSTEGAKEAVARFKILRRFPYDIKDTLHCQIY